MIPTTAFHFHTNSSPIQQIKVTCHFYEIMVNIHMKFVMVFVKLSSCGQWRLWSDWADAQADLSLRWAHMPFCMFCRAAAHTVLHVYHSGLSATFLEWGERKRPNISKKYPYFFNRLTIFWKKTSAVWWCGPWIWMISPAAVVKENTHWCTPLWTK